MQHYAQSHGATYGRAAWRATWRLLVLLGLLPALFLGSSSGTEALFRCRATQLVETSCCCPNSDILGTAEISPSCCCERVQLDSALPTGALHGDGHPVAEGFGPVVRRATARELFAVAEAPPQDPRGLALERGRARAGPSLVILHRRFLI